MADLSDMASRGGSTDSIPAPHRLATGWVMAWVKTRDGVGSGPVSHNLRLQQRAQRSTPWWRAPSVCMRQRLLQLERTSVPTEDATERRDRSRVPEQ